MSKVRKSKLLQQVQEEPEVQQQLQVHEEAEGASLPPASFLGRIETGLIEFGPEVRVTPFVLKVQGTTFPRNILDVVADLASQGKSVRSICHLIGLSHNRWYSWQREGIFPELHEAYALGRALEEDALVATLHKQSRSFAPAAMFLLKSRFSYKEGEAAGGGGRAGGVTVNIVNIPRAAEPQEFLNSNASPILEGGTHD